MATDAEKANTAMSNLTNGEPELSLHRDVGAASANIHDPDPLSRDTKENIDDKNSNSGAGDLLSRDNTGDLSDKKEENTAAGGDPLRGENPDKKEENNVGDVDPLRGENSDDGGAGDTTEKVENKEETQEDEWEDILGNSLLKKKVNKKGDGRESRPMMGSTVTIKTKTVLLDETEVDVYDSYKFVLGDGDVLQALDLCVALMELHEEAVIATGYKYAWGEIGRKPDIPPKADLMIFVELLQVDPGPDYLAMEVPDRIKEADSKRERGNFLYRRSEYSTALNSYTKGLQIIDPQNGYSDKPEILQQLLELRTKLLCNTAACQNKLSAHDAAIKTCEEALKLQPNNPKALYRCGKAHEVKGNKAEAVKFLKLSLKYDETNSKDSDFDTQMVHAELAKLTKELKRETDKEKQIYQKMFGGPAVKKQEEKSMELFMSNNGMFRHITASQVDQDGSAAAAGPRTEGGELVPSGAGAQSENIEAPSEKTSLQLMVQFLQTLGVVIDADSPYVNLQIQMALSELVNFFQTINKPEIRRLNAEERRNSTLEEMLVELVEDAKKQEARNRTTYLQSSGMNTNVTVRLINTMKALITKNGDCREKKRGHGKRVRPGLRRRNVEVLAGQIAEALEGPAVVRQSSRSDKSSWMLAAAGGAVAAAAVSFGVYRYMNH